MKKSPITNKDKYKSSAGTGKGCKDDGDDAVGRQ
jgi:hypothetical protein